MKLLIDNQLPRALADHHAQRPAFALDQDRVFRAVFTAIRGVDADGNQSAACAPATITPSAGNPANRLASVDAALRWLEANQGADGSWGGDITLDRKLISTAQAMRAIARDGRWAADRPHLVRRGLSYLRGRFVDENDAIIRSIDALQRHGEPAESLHTRLAIRGMLAQQDHLVGWASHRQYYPDALHTALGLLARRNAAIAPPWTNDDALLAGSSLQAATSGRYSWVPGSGDDSIYVSAVAYAAMDANRYSTAGDYAWILSEAATDYRDSIIDTAGVLIYLSLNPSDRAEAEDLLIAAQHADGSWRVDGATNGDPFLTALCLEALSHARVVHIRAQTSAADDAIEDILERRAVDLEVVDNDDALPLGIAESHLIVVSATAAPTGFDLDDLLPLHVPMLICNADYFDEFDLTGADAALHDVNASITSVQIVDPTHPLSGGLDDGSPVTVLGVGSAVSWGDPQGPAIVVAADPSSANEAYIFAYEPGAVNANGELTPARRVGFFLGDGADDLEDEGKDLLDAAVEWLLYVRAIQ